MIAIVKAMGNLKINFAEPERAVSVNCILYPQLATKFDDIGQAYEY